VYGTRVYVTRECFAVGLTVVLTTRASNSSLITIICYSHSSRTYASAREVVLSVFISVHEHGHIYMCVCLCVCLSVCLHSMQCGLSENSCTNVSD